MGVTPVFEHLDEALDGVPRCGVVHVGAHKGQEVPYYREAGFERITLIEPNPAHFDEIVRFGETVYPYACGERGTATLHRTKWSEQSSIHHPTSLEVLDTIEVDVLPLSEMQSGCNVAVLDVQGAELAVLRTADLLSLDAVIVELDASHRYDGAGTPDEIRAYLLSYGWRLGSVWPHRWEFLTEEVWLR